MSSTSMPLARKPSDSAALKSRLDSRPSRRIAAVVPPARTTIEPKQRPIAKASAADSVRPTMPRISYSRSEVGSKSCLNAMRLPRSVVMFQERAHGFTQIGAFQGEGDLGFQVSDFITAIEPFSFIAQSVKRLTANQFRHAVGQLDFIAGAA